MKFLMDTHVFLWMNFENEKLSKTFTTLGQSGEHEFFLSMASAWEMQIKHQLGKLPLSMPIEELINTNQQASAINLLNIKLPHITQLNNLAMHHKDPFDRLIIAQAITENMHIISVDQHFKNYPVEVVW